MSGDEYTAVYKCRLCGEHFITAITGRAKAAGITISLVLGIDNNEPQAPTMQYIHYCENGGIGIADFQGWAVKGEKAESEKGCEYCRGTVYTEKPFIVKTGRGEEIPLAFEYCPNCGRKLEKDGENNDT